MMINLTKFSYLVKQNDTPSYFERSHKNHPMDLKKKKYLHKLETHQNTVKRKSGLW